mgnify:CR=1 FL=1
MGILELLYSVEQALRIGRVDRLPARHRPTGASVRQRLEPHIDAVLRRHPCDHHLELQRPDRGHDGRAASRVVDPILGFLAEQPDGPAGGAGGGWPEKKPDYGKVYKDYHVTEW